MNIKKTLSYFIPKIIEQPVKDLYRKILYQKYLTFGREKVFAETSKAKARRMREGFFQKYCSGKGLDIGYGGDRIIETVDVWDIEHGDALELKNVQNDSYDFVYSSHTIEHMLNPEIALRNWFRVVKPNGYLIVYLPHRDLYEKKLTLPSRFNPDHKYFFVEDNDDLPYTIGIKTLIERTLKCFQIVYIKVCNENYISNGIELHSTGEYSIEFVVKKLQNKND